MCNNGVNFVCLVDIDGIDNIVLFMMNIRIFFLDNCFNLWTLVFNGVFEGGEGKVLFLD